jgi:hypothetical protein
MWRFLSEPPATHGHEWLCCGRMLGVSPHPPLSTFLILSRADSQGSSVGPINHVLRAIRGHMPPSHSRSQFPLFALPHIASDSPKGCVQLANLRHGRRSNEVSLSRAEPFAIGFCAAQHANGSAGERSRSLPWADLPLRYFKINSRGPVPRVND